MPPPVPILNVFATPQGLIHKSAYITVSRGQRLQKEECLVLPEMSLCFMAFCVAIKHLLGRQLIYQASLLFPLPQRSNSLKVLFTNLRLFLRKETESENHSLDCKCLKCAHFRVTVLIGHRLFCMGGWGVLRLNIRQTGSSRLSRDHVRGYIFFSLASSVPGMFDWGKYSLLVLARG